MAKATDDMTTSPSITVERGRSNVTLFIGATACPSARRAAQVSPVHSAGSRQKSARSSVWPKAASAPYMSVPRSTKTAMTATPATLRSAMRENSSISAISSTMFVYPVPTAAKAESASGTSENWSAADAVPKTAQVLKAVPSWRSNHRGAAQAVSEASSIPVRNSVCPSAKAWRSSRSWARNAVPWPGRSNHRKLSAMATVANATALLLMTPPRSWSESSRRALPPLGFLCAHGSKIPRPALFWGPRWAWLGGRGGKSEVLVTCRPVSPGHLGRAARSMGGFGYMGSPWNGAIMGASRASGPCGFGRTEEAGPSGRTRCARRANEHATDIQEERGLPWRQSTCRGVGLWERAWAWGPWRPLGR